MAKKNGVHIGFPGVVQKETRTICESSIKDRLSGSVPVTTSQVNGNQITVVHDSGVSEKALDKIRRVLSQHCRHTEIVLKAS